MSKIDVYPLIQSPPQDAQVVTGTVINGQKVAMDVAVYGGYIQLGTQDERVTTTDHGGKVSLDVRSFELQCAVEQMIKELKLINLYLREFLECNLRTEGDET